MNKKLLEILACPICKHHPLEEFDVNEKDGLVTEGALFCTECSRFFQLSRKSQSCFLMNYGIRNKILNFLRNTLNHFQRKLLTMVIHGTCEKDW